MAAFSLQGRVALVTGGNNGLGLSFASSLALAGASVAVFDITPPSAGYLALSATYGVKTTYYTVNVSSLSSLENGFASLSRDFEGKLDICVANAGVNCLEDFLETKEESFDRVMSINIKGVYYTAQLAAKAMIHAATKDGSIILVASTAAHVATRTHNSSAYAATKGAVKGMVPELAKELAKHKIRVNSISPGFTLTEMTRGYPNFLESWRKDVMLDRVAEPEDYGGTLVYLASDASQYVTGQDLLVDGGMSKW